MRWKLCCVIIPVLCMSALAMADVYKWVDSDGNVHFSDAKPKEGPVEQVKLEAPNIVNGRDNLPEGDNSGQVLQGKSRVLAWQITEEEKDHAVVTVSYFYNGEYNDIGVWLGVTPNTNYYSVRPIRLKPGENTGEVYIGINGRAPAGFCTSKLSFQMYGKHLPLIFSMSDSYDKCWERKE